MPKQSRHTDLTPSLFPPDASESAAETLPVSWQAILGNELAKPYFKTLSEFVAAERAQYEILPALEDTYRAFYHTPYEQVKVVLLGQDPYPTPGHAHGLCFSVKPGVRIPASLRNIYKELQSDLGIQPPAHGHLAAWAQQGVLMLNTVLTVRAGQAASHAKRGWETFTDAVLTSLNAAPRPIVFLLWGGHAQKKRPLIDSTRHCILESVHPSPLSAYGGFFGSKPFSKINAALEANGQQPIEWKW
jgi:uracil-DNA glycosylase